MTANQDQPADYLTEAIEAATARVHEMLLHGGHKCEEIGAEAVRAAAPIIERAVRDKIVTELKAAYADAVAFYDAPENKHIPAGEVQGLASALKIAGAL